ncbi:hypothetical protein [Janthinobacterium lividum]|uniref:hypothetical protein n=1 Tax=Janthinobacterium lividum TaxID=29581 RepID=UPI000FE1E675|nr:hypothetical protein [Janthinobacterium lividum]
MKFMLHCRKFCPEISVIKVPKTNVHPGRPHRHTGPSGPEKCRGQGAATQTVRQYGKELQRRHRHFLRPAYLARFYAGPSGPEKCRGQGAATQTVRQYGKELQRRHRHFLRPASLARFLT